MNYLPLVAMVVFATVFYRAGKMERSWGLLWAAMSAGISILTLFLLHWGWVGFFGGQVLLFFGITIYRKRQTPQSSVCLR